MKSEIKRPDRAARPTSLRPPNAGRPLDRARRSVASVDLGLHGRAVPGRALERAAIRFLPPGAPRIEGATDGRTV